ALAPDAPASGPANVPAATAEINRDVICAQLRRLAASRPLARCQHLVELLEFLTSKTLQGEGTNLKEYLIGLEALGKGQQFDPRIDPAVRVAAHRLRTKLRSYYRSEGRQDEIVIELPRGGYIPTIVRRPIVSS